MITENWTKEIIIGGRPLSLYELPERVIGEYDQQPKRVFAIEIIKKTDCVPVNPSLNQEFSFVWEGTRFSMSQDADGKLYIDIAVSENPSLSGTPAYELLLYGIPLATDSDKSVIFHDFGYTTNDVEKYEHMMVGGMPHTVGRVGNKWYWIVHPVS